MDSSSCSASIHSTTYKMPDRPDTPDTTKGAGGKDHCRSALPAWSGPALVGLILLAGMLLCRMPAQAAPIAVRFTEGMVRGFLVVTDSKGTRIGSGDFLQVSKGGEIKCRTLLHFKDGSLHDESAVFTQQHKFLMKSYHLVQKGPAFSDEMDATVDRESGKYTVKIKSRKDGQEKVLDGKLDLPPDVYNGMVPTVGKNLVKGAKETIHMIAFTPTPRIIELEMTPSGEDKVLIGDLEKTAVHYVLKPKLGVLLAVPAALLGRTPPDNHLWTITSDVPAFVKFTGPLAAGGPIWSIELTSPVWRK